MDLLKKKGTGWQKIGLPKDNDPRKANTKYTNNIQLENRMFKKIDIIDTKPRGS